jgi:hypothetical protein
MRWADFEINKFSLFPTFCADRLHIYVPCVGQHWTQGPRIGRQKICRNSVIGEQEQILVSGGQRIPVAVRPNAYVQPPLECWNHGLESRWGHGCLSLGFVACCVGSGLCDGPFSYSEEPYWVYDLETTKRGGLGPIWAVAPKKMEPKAVIVLSK